MTSVRLIGPRPGRVAWRTTHEIGELDLLVEIDLVRVHLVQHLDGDRQLEQALHGKLLVLVQPEHPPCRQLHRREPHRPARRLSDSRKQRLRSGEQHGEASTEGLEHQDEQLRGVVASTTLAGTSIEEAPRGERVAWKTTIGEDSAAPPCFPTPMFITSLGYSRL